MEDHIAELIKISEECKSAAAKFETRGFNKLVSVVDDVIREVDRASSQSWIGYQASVYYTDFAIPRPGDHFNKEWGFQGIFQNATSGNWREYSSDFVKDYIFNQSGSPEESEFIEVANDTSNIFDKCKEKLLPIFAILLEDTNSETMEEYRDGIKKLKSHFTPQELMTAVQPSGQFFSRDSLAISQGLMAPPHIGVRCWIFSLRSYFTQIAELAKTIDMTVTYLRQKYRSAPLNKTSSGKIFIGHGRSLLWRDLSSFLSDRLKLEWDEFNREASAGISTKERLEAMLDNASFAFLIMTGEDEHTDSSFHARENVIHEIGLFQGRLTFRRAIVLLEEGCQEFSNIHGIGQIKFPKGNIRAAFEDIRLTLEREGFIT